jgi:hypothetical protein
MRSLTTVYVPANRNRQEEEFKDWCSERVSPYSTEITWTYKRIGKHPFLVFEFGEPTDAMAFKLKFGL